MKNAHLHSQIAELIRVEDPLCITLIFPLHALPQDKKLDRITADHAITRLQQLLENSHEASVVNGFIEKIRALEPQLTELNGMKGVGIFASQSFVKVIPFPFEVKECIRASRSFDLRDVACKASFERKYYVLSMRSDEVRLFRGSAGHLEEIIDQNFPCIYEAPDYSAPALAEDIDNSAVTLKREKAVVAENPQAFLNTVDRRLTGYLLSEEPIFLAGVEKELAGFTTTTHHKRHIAGRVHGSYNHYNHGQLAEKSWTCMQQILNREQLDAMNQLIELFGRELVSVGIRDVWRNALQGKGLLLVVERDYVQPAFKVKDEYQLWLSPPFEEHEILSDAVSMVIETVLRKDGRVQFVDNGLLKDFAGISLIHRY